MRINNGPRFASHQVNWKWERGVSTLADFGDPVSGASNYRLCIYGDTGSGSSLLIQARAPGDGLCSDSGNPCWYTTRNGYVYSDRDRSPDGIVRVTLEPSAGRKLAKVLVRVVGDNLTLPPAQSTTAFAPGITLKVQLVRDDSATCWESEFTPPATRNTGTQYSDRVREP